MKRDIQEESVNYLKFNMVTIVPSILAKDITAFERDLKKVEGLVKRVQLDVVDGKFEETVTVGPEVIREVTTAIEFDVHLMVERPEYWIERCAEAGAVGVWGEVEMMEDRVRFVADVQAAGMKAGLAYDVNTSLDGLDEVIHDLDAVLLMSVKAGAQGREFQDSVYEKIKQVRKLSKTVKIIVDGGLDEEKIKGCFVSDWSEELAEDEMDRSFAKMEFAVGSHLLMSEDIALEIDNLQKLAQKHQ